MTMPASQPVDYVTAIRNIVDDINDGAEVLGDVDSKILTDLADQLAALRKTVDGCGRKGEGMNAGSTCGDDWECAMCRETQIEILLALSHTNPRDAHAR